MHNNKNNRACDHDQIYHIPLNEWKREVIQASVPTCAKTITQHQADDAVYWEKLCLTNLRKRNASRIAAGMLDCLEPEPQI